MAVYGSPTHTLVPSIFGFALGKEAKSEQPLADSLIERASDSPVTSQIQQASWNQLVDSPTASVVTTPKSLATPAQQVVRDNAPPSMHVIGWLIGFGVFSLVLYVSSLPFHWYQGDTTKWR